VKYWDKHKIESRVLAVLLFSQFLSPSVRKYECLVVDRVVERHLVDEGGVVGAGKFIFFVWRCSVQHESEMLDLQRVKILFENIFNTSAKVRSIYENKN
jgi:hypothetical protein